MIVKIKSTDEKQNSWRWYEADHVQSSTKKFRDFCDAEGKFHLINGDGVSESLMLYGVDVGTEDIEMDRKVTLISFLSEDGTVNNVICDTEAYLLNNNGETIDRLN